MKKILLTLSLFMAMSITYQAKAQTNPGFGFKAGINFANLSNTESDVGTRTGFMLGTYLNYIIPYSPVSIQPELLYSQKGYINNGRTIELDYLEIPVLTSFHFTTDQGFIPRIYFGPYIGFNVNAKRETDDTEFVPPGERFNEYIRGTDFGFVVGAGVDVNILNVGIRYSTALTNVFKNSSGKNSVFSITAGIGF